MADTSIQTPPSNTISKDDRAFDPSQITGDLANMSFTPLHADELPEEAEEIVKRPFKWRDIDIIICTLPLLVVTALVILFVTLPEGSNRVVTDIRNFLGDTLGFYYLIMGVFMVGTSMFLAFSKYGEIRLGPPGSKPIYSSFKWGCLMYTAGIAADILFYSLCEWVLYATDPFVQGLTQSKLHEWSATYPLFHWGPIPWSFYLVVATCFGFMIHVKGTNKQKYSEACRGLLGKWVDGFVGQIIDFIAVLALIAGTATTFSLATPLCTSALSSLTGLPDNNWVTIAILAVICVIYSAVTLIGMKGLSIMADACIYLFGLLLAYVFFVGGQWQFILEGGITAIGNLAQNFIWMATQSDMTRETSFPQAWTIFYWSYWMVWCVATPFFIGTISKGRTVKQVILGGYMWGLAATFTSFIVLGNYSLGLQMTEKFDVISAYLKHDYDLYATIMDILRQLPAHKVFLAILVVAIVIFFATTFDAVAYVASFYAYKDLNGNEEPSRAVRAYWSLLLICFPIALIFSDSSMANLQSVSIIVAFPIGIVMIMFIASFIIDARKYLADSQVFKREKLEQQQVLLGESSGSIVKRQ